MNNPPLKYRITIELASGVGTPAFNCTSFGIMLDRIVFHDPDDHVSVTFIKFRDIRTIKIEFLE